MIHSSLIIINNSFHFCNPFCISNIKFYQMIHSSLTIMIHSSFEIYYVYCIVLIHCILSICLVFTVALLISHLVIQYNPITHSSLIIMNDPFQFCNPFCISNIQHQFLSNDPFQFDYYDPFQFCNLFCILY